jgi:hypothetical protein
MELSQASKDLYNNEDKKGKFQTVPLLVSGKRNGETGKIWKGINPNKQGKEGMHWVTTLDKLDEYDAQGLVYFPKNGATPRLKYYLEQSPGVPLGEIWDDIKLVQGKESIGYPTQKPIALLERIIKCASNEGELVLDPFMGGGTTIAVADKLNRSWIGIDQSVQAVKVAELRLQQQTDLFTALYANSYTLQLYKYDYDMLRYQNAFEFESWIVGQLGGASNAKQRNDFGSDGKMPDGTPIQVKRSDSIGRNVVDNFFAAVQRYDKKLFEKNIAEKKPVGYIIAFSFGRGAVEEVARLKLSENVAINLMKVEDIVPVAKKPTIAIEINELSRNENGAREIEFIATGKSEASIEFYSWDFDYQADRGFKPSVIMDREGIQKRLLKAGFYSVAVKVVDNDGLESVEVIKLKVNGVVEITS